MCRPLEVFACRQLECAVEIDPCADIALVSVLSDPRIPIHVFATDLLRSVGGGIVGNNQLKIFELLREDGVDGLTKEGSPIIDR